MPKLFFGVMTSVLLIGTTASVSQPDIAATTRDGSNSRAVVESMFVQQTTSGTCSEPPVQGCGRRSPVQNPS